MTACTVYCDKAARYYIGNALL